MGEEGPSNRSLGGSDFKGLASSTPHHPHTIRTIDSRSSSMSSLGRSETLFDLMNKNPKLAHRSEGRNSVLDDSSDADSESDDSEGESDATRGFRLGMSSSSHLDSPIVRTETFSMDQEGNRTPHTPSISRFSDTDDPASPYQALQLTPSARQMSPSNISSVYVPKSPNIILKKLISRNPGHSKTFKRISKELQSEISPLDNEIMHEAEVTLSLKDDEENCKQDANKMYEIVNQANEAWNHRKCSMSEAAARQQPPEQRGTKRKPQDDDTVASKRRAVVPFASSRRNSKLIQNANEDFEMLSLQ